MSRTIAYICNDLNLSPAALGLLRPDVRMGAPAESSGFGFAWFQGKQSLLRTTPRPGGDGSSFLDLMADLPTRAAIGQLRDAKDGFVDALEVQPFRFRNWIFAHAGDEASEQRCDELVATIPGFLGGKRRGKSFGELVGHVFFGQLHRHNLLDGRHDSKLLAQALAEAVRLVTADGTLASFGFLALTKGTLLAANIGRAMHFSEIRGITVEKEPPLFAGHKPKMAEHPRFKAFAVTDAPLNGQADAWRAVPDHRVLYIDDDWQIEFETI